MYQTIKCRKISRGKAKGKVIITQEPISFLGGINPENGMVIDAEHELYQQIITDQILVMPRGKGSTVGSYVIYQMAKNKTAPRAIIALEAEPIIATGAIMAEIPMVDHPEAELMNMIKNNDIVEVDADQGIIRIFN